MVAGDGFTRPIREALVTLLRLADGVLERAVHQQLSRAARVVRLALAHKADRMPGVMDQVGPRSMDATPRETAKLRKEPAKYGMLTARRA